MITGRQIREARKLLGWNLAALSGMANIPVDIIKCAESGDGTPGVTMAQVDMIRALCEATGRPAEIVAKG